MKKYDHEKLIRLRTRSREIAQNAVLAAEDMREHVERVRDAETHLDRIRQHPYPPGEPGRPDPRERDLAQAQERLEKAQSGKAKCQARVETLKAQQATIVPIVAKLEDTITREWRLPLPDDDQINFPNVRRTTFERNTH